MADHPQDENSAPNQADDPARHQGRPPGQGRRGRRGAGRRLPAQDREARPQRRRPVVDLGDRPPRRARHGRQAQPEDAAELEPEGRLRLPELRLARSRRRAQDRRVLRERREGGRRARRRARASRRSSSRSTRSPDLPKQSDLWLDAAGAPHAADGPAARARTTTSRSRGTDAFALIGARAERARVTGRGVVLHLRPRQQRGGVPVPPFARQFGTNNLPDCSNMCHESSGLGLTETIGIGKATVKLEDFEHADSIFVIGQNPGTNHPRMLTELQKAAKQRLQDRQRQPAARDRDDPLQEPAGPARRCWARGRRSRACSCRCAINGDVALLKGIMKEMLEEDRRRGRQGARRTTSSRITRRGSTRFAARPATPRRWDEIVEDERRVARADRARRAAIALASERMICCWAMGITQHSNGVANVQSIVNFALLRGQIGRPGAGLCPVRGHSNVQGDRTVGIWEKMSAAFLERAGQGVQLRAAAQARPRHRRARSRRCTRAR